MTHPNSRRLLVLLYVLLVGCVGRSIGGDDSNALGGGEARSNNDAVTHRDAATHLDAGADHDIAAQHDAKSDTACEFGACDGKCVVGSVQDVEGNRYRTVKIGSQVWMQENLATTRLNDNAPIALVADNAAWIHLMTPAYCFYENTSSYAQTYGALYNWYAVATGKLCPVGWHVPSDADFRSLIHFLGGEAVAGGKLKEAGRKHWMSPNTGATNESCFTALPAGDRIGSDGSFYNLYGYAIFWTSDASSLAQAINRVLFFEGTNFRIGYDSKFAGFSIRCVRD